MTLSGNITPNLLDALPVGVLHVSASGTVITVNELVRRLLPDQAPWEKVAVTDLLPDGLMSLQAGESIHCVVGGTPCAATLTRLPGTADRDRIITLIPQSAL